MSPLENWRGFVASDEVRLAGRIRDNPAGHDERVAIASASRSPAELAGLTADLPAGIAARLPAVRDVWLAVGLILAAVSVLAVIVALQPDNALAFVAEATLAARLADLEHAARVIAEPVRFERWTPLALAVAAVADSRNIA